MSEERVRELEAKLIGSQSKSFELLAGLTEERDTARVGVQNLENIINQVVSTLGLETPNVSELFQRLNELVATEQQLAENASKRTRRKKKPPVKKPTLKSVKKK